MSKKPDSVARCSSRCYDAECRAAKKYLRDLVRATEAVIEWMDAEMKKPSDNDRGKRIASVLNGLEMQKDLAKRFGLPQRKRKSS